MRSTWLSTYRFTPISSTLQAIESEMSFNVYEKIPRSYSLSVLLTERYNLRVVKLMRPVRIQCL
jgi:hypothetical protein